MSLTPRLTKVPGTVITLLAPPWRPAPVLGTAASLAVAVLAPAFAASQEAPEYPTEEEITEAENAPLFQSHGILEMTLTADFHTMREDDRSDEDSQARPATMEWINADGTPGSLEIAIQTRGNFRLSKQNCDFPPLRLDVDKSEAEGTLFEIQDKIKMVVPCKLGQDYWEQYVLAEYLVYRTLNVLTPISFRTRLARVTFVDSSGEDDPFTRYAFMLEDDSELAKRAGGIKQDWQGGQLNPVLLKRDYAILVEFFQYMIGNTDWSGAEMHNMELIRDADQRRVAVPFDFDFSGIIDTRYAVPDASLPIRSVRRRLFRGFCPDQLNRPPEAYEAVVALFQEKKEEIYDLWRNLEPMEEDRREDKLDYLDEFYETLADPDRVQSRMLDQCIRIGRVP
jgi:hypothetical protein